MTARQMDDEHRRMDDEHRRRQEEVEAQLRAAESELESTRRPAREMDGLSNLASDHSMNVSRIELTL